MKPKFFLLGILVLFSIFIQYKIKNEIIMTSRENRRIELELVAEKAVNKDLQVVCIELQALPRIHLLATTRLNMISSSNNPNRIHIVRRTTRNNRTLFTYLDHFTPSAQALTHH